MPSTFIPLGYVSLSDALRRYGEATQGDDWDTTNKDKVTSAYTSLRQKLNVTSPVDGEDNSLPELLTDDGKHFPVPPEIWADDGLSWCTLQTGRLKFHPIKYGWDWSPTAAHLDGRVIIPNQILGALLAPTSVPTDPGVDALRPDEVDDNSSGSEVSDHELKQSINDWYVEERIPAQNKKNNIPAREECEKAARNKFGKGAHIREMVREIRAEHAPDSWTRTGPKGINRKLK